MNDNVRPFTGGVQRSLGDNSNDGGGGNIPGMEARLSEVERAIVRIDATLPTLATRDELHKGFSETVKWIVGTGLAGGAAFLTVIAFTLNNAIPKTPTPVTPAPPVIVNVMPAAAPTPATPPTRK